MSQGELDRIRSTYRSRDASGETPYRWDNPGYLTYIQSLERALLRAVADAGVRLTGARVLDVGCGSGYLLQRLREYGAGDCTGIDLMESRIEEGRRRYPTLNLQAGSATELPFPSGTFDLVTQFTCLSSILDDDLRLAAAREMQRVASGGWLLSFDMRGKPRLGLRPASSSVTVPIDGRELRRLFGDPALLRKAALTFDLAQYFGRHAVVATALAALPPLRSHLLGLWRVA